MWTESFKKKLLYWGASEGAFIILLWVLYFTALAFSKERPHIHYWEFIFAANYFLVVIVINYWLLPRFFYRKRYYTFLFWSLAAIAAAIVVNEVLLEPVFLSGRGIGRRSAEGGFRDIAEIGPIILLFVGFKLAWDNLKKQSQLEALEREKAEGELQFLKSQLNPHFLFNNLNNLYSYAQENSPKTPEIILQLSNIMRYMLYESREHYVPLEKELACLQDFIRLQELQMESRGKVVYSVEGNTTGKMIAPLLLIPFVENSFKHSLSSQADNISIGIKVEIREVELHFRCTNTYLATKDGPGRYVAKGIGLDNVRKRLKLLYPGRHRLDIQTEGGQYVVKLELGLGNSI
ncbi:MAG: histidine kinase [Phaeodactylibacter sp.]|nr:histidine kinase [Phaeodactylibacter sp.]MCB9049915.1 histidine kinase [Lewinellaceae bacterium]